MDVTVPGETRNDSGTLFRIRTGWALAAVLLAAFGIRLYLSVLAFASTFDTSTPGLMGLHILQGARPLFYYGQNYLGAIEAYLAALLFALFGPSLTTLSLSPILLSLGWVAATYLMFRELFGRRAGLAAALTAAVPSWHTLWYTTASYGGYAGALFFGTAALWLAIRVARRELTPAGEWWHILILGLVSGLALWTNLLAVEYLLTGTVVLAVYLTRVRFAPRILVKFFFGGLLFLIGVEPELTVFTRVKESSLASFDFSPGFMWQNLGVMSEKAVPEFFAWPLEYPAILVGGAVLCFILSSLLFLLRLFRHRGRADLGWALVPLLFAAIFLALYLPHTMARLGAPRYLIPLAAMTAGAVFAAPVTLPRPGWRRVSWCLLTLWIGYHAAGAILTARAKAPEKERLVARRNQVVENASRAGARTVFLVGGITFGFQGQTLSFYARDRIRFVSPFLERYQPAAQAAETDPAYALAFNTSHTAAVLRSLETLRARYALIEGSWLSLAYDIRVPAAGRRSIPPAEMRAVTDHGAREDTASVTDRVRESYLEGDSGAAGGFVLELGRERLLDSIWLVAPDWLQTGLPRGYTLEISRDGREYRSMQEVRESVPVSYVAGERVYMEGYFGLREIRLEPAPARFVRFRRLKTGAKSRKWRVGEVFVFEHRRPAAGDIEDDVPGIVSALNRHGVEFTVADRWLSARLREEYSSPPHRPPGYPRLNPRHPSTVMSRRITPLPGRAIAVRSELAEECAALLGEIYSAAAVKERIEFARYTLFILRGAPKTAPTAPDLIWNGHSLLKTSLPAGKVY